MLTDITLHMMIPTYRMTESSGCVSNELVWKVALASPSTIRNKSLFYQIELTYGGSRLTTLGRQLVLHREYFAPRRPRLLLVHEDCAFYLTFMKFVFSYCGDEMPATRVYAVSMVKPCS